MKSGGARRGADPHARGDDNDGNDDEDGVVFSLPLVAGNPATLVVTVSVDGFIDAWVDFAGDGSWSEPGDQIFMAQPLAMGSNPLNFVVPGTGVASNSSAVRR